MRKAKVLALFTSLFMILSFIPNLTGFSYVLLSDQSTNVPESEEIPTILEENINSSSDLIIPINISSDPWRKGFLHVDLDNNMG